MQVNVGVTHEQVALLRRAVTIGNYGGDISAVIEYLISRGLDDMLRSGIIAARVTCNHCGHQEVVMRVIAKATNQPTPERGWDFVAFVEGTQLDEDQVTEFGRTEQQAIDNFILSHCPCDIDHNTGCFGKTECQRRFDNAAEA